MTAMDVEKREHARRQAMLDGDAAALDSLMDARCVYVHSSGFVDSGAAMIAKIRSGEVAYLGLDFSREQVTHFGRSSVFVYRQRATMMLAGASHDSDSLCTAVWSVDDAGDPRLISFHSAFTETHP